MLRIEVACNEIDAFSTGSGSDASTALLSAASTAATLLGVKRDKEAAPSKGELPRKA